MKKIIGYGLLLLTATACKKQEVAWERPDKKLGELIAQYETQLTTAPNGWIGYLFPEGGGGYTFKFVFTPDNRVRTQAAMNAAYATTAKESSYRLKATQVISLYFDSYSYLHELSDPDPAKSGGAAGQGLVSDFEFSILNVSPDTLRLKGNLNGSELLLVRANANQGADYIERAFLYNQYVNEVNGFSNYFNKIEIADRTYGITINTEINTVSFYYGSDDDFKRFNTEYAVADDGIILRTPFNDGALTITSLNDFDIEPDEYRATLKVNDEIDAVILNLPEPFIIDRDAPRRMYIESYVYSSSTGVNFSGTFDIFDVRSIPGFVRMVYEPRYYVDNYDILFTVFNNGANTVGPVFRTAFNSEGIMDFSNYLGLSGTNPGAAHLPKIQNTAAIWTDPEGFYAYQTGKNAYDLVSVSDGRIWIRFR
ncbi:DUF4302 domain-containing protein [Parapedobacter composti]|nr:DUF4302 domain-containing protein [Parapedobacter composti]